MTAIDPIATNAAGANAREDRRAKRFARITKLDGWFKVLGLPWPIAVLGGLATGAALGFVNGWTVVRTGLHSFIITLATMSIFFGAMIFLTRAESYRALPDVFSAFGKQEFGTRFNC